MMNFNQTIVTSIQTLAPIWAEQLVKAIGLTDNRYVTVFSMLINAVSNLFNGQNEYVDYILKDEHNYFKVIYSILCICYIIRYFYKCPNMLFDNGNNIRLFNIENNIFENYLYDNQHWFQTKPKWFIDNVHNYCTDNKLGGDYHLEPNTYRVNIKDTLVFDITTIITVVKDTQKHAIIFSFSSGNINELTKFILDGNKMIKKDMEGISTILYSESLIKRIHKSHMDREMAFDKYYFNRKDEILEWFDNQTTQVSLLLYGKSRTGKTEFAKRLAHRTGKHVICVDLLKIKKMSSLLSLMYDGTLIDKCGYSVYDFPIGSVIIFFDEFDKTLNRLNILQENKKSKEERQYTMLLCKNDKDTNKEETTFADSYDWTLDDLLSIFSGVYTPVDRTIIATANDINVIKEYCPYLLGCGRMTPIEFVYGDKDMFIKIVKELSGVCIQADHLRDNFQFIQANLIEYLKFNKDVNEIEILSNMDKFVVEN